MKNLFYLFVLMLLLSCSNDPKPIDYGNEACDFCDMTIVSNSFAAQAVSDKGKQFKYDAIECMVHDLSQNNTPMALQQVANFLKPGEMIPVKNAVFIINDSINSPMGANLAAVKTKPANAATGIFSWKELIKHLNQKSTPGVNP